MECTDFSFIPLYEQIDFFSALVSLGISYAKQSNQVNKEIILKSMAKGNRLIIQMIFPNIENNKDDIAETKLNELLQMHNVSVSKRVFENQDMMSMIMMFPTNGRVSTI